MVFIMEGLNSPSGGDVGVVAGEESNTAGGGGGSGGGSSMPDLC